jgi:hypothetical protein
MHSKLTSRNIRNRRALNFGHWLRTNRYRLRFDWSASEVNAGKTFTKLFGKKSNPIFHGE